MSLQYSKEGETWKPILAIDPGPTHSAFVVWDGVRVLELGKVPNKDLLGDLHLRRVATRPLVVIEMIASYGMAVGAEIFETCVWIGRFIEACEGRAERIKRLEIKQHICHDSRAKDSNIRQALIDRLGAPGTKKEPGTTFGVSKDIWSALAVAVVAHDRRRQ